MVKSRLLFSMLLICLTLSGYAQNNVSSKAKKENLSFLQKGSIATQFNLILKKSSSYKEYKAVKGIWLSKFGTNVQDSLIALRNKLKSIDVENKSLDAKILNLTSKVDSLEQKQAEVINKEDKMEIVGISVTKSSYSTIMWCLVLGLLILAGFCFMLFKRSNLITVETKETLNDVREEFDTYRKNALLREQKLARKLQDEVMKNKSFGL